MEKHSPASRIGVSAGHKILDCTQAHFGGASPHLAGSRNRRRTIAGKYSLKEDDDFGIPENISPLFAAGESVSLDAWEKRRVEIRSQWLETLGHPTEKDTGGAPEKIGEFSRPDCVGSLFRQPTIGGASALMVLLEPTKERYEKSPGVILPFYTPDLVAGYDFAADQPSFDRPGLQFGYHLVQQGYKAVCIEAFPYNTVAGLEKYGRMEVWAQAAKQLLAKNPSWTGAGRLISDTVRAVDFLCHQRNIDLDRIAIIGHSLGGKMAFMTAAYDDRIKAVIGSDFGMGWNFTNWNDPWYYGEKISAPGFFLGNHHLLALIAPRPFLLIGGEADRAESRQYLKEGGQIHQLYGRPDAVGFLHHASGHNPPAASVEAGYQWLAEQFELPSHPWKFPPGLPSEPAIP